MRLSSEDPHRELMQTRPRGRKPGRGRDKRKRKPVSELVKKIKRREENREAAKMSRERKKYYIKVLEAKVFA